MGLALICIFILAMVPPVSAISIREIRDGCRAQSFNVPQCTTNLTCQVGPQGPQGIQGIPGTDGAANMTAGPQGPQGPQGDPGPAGSPGLDANVSAAYPVGSVYISTVSTNPSVLLGFGTWVRIAQGRVLIGQDDSNAAFQTGGQTGGNYTQTPSEHEAP